jgi:hypothetical protein
MPWIVALLAGVLAIVGWRRRHGRGDIRRLTDPELKKKKKERVVLAVEPGGTQGIRLVEETPSTIRARGGKQVKWLVDVDDTDGRSHTLAIGKFEENGEARSQDDIFEAGTRLYETIAADSKGKILKIKGKLNSRLNTHRFTYKVLIDGKEAEVETLGKARANADDGEFYVCPVWPCD